MEKITKKEIEELNRIRKERRKYEKLDKELSAKLLAKANGKTSEEWQTISYEIVDGKNTFANKEEIQKLPDWEKYYKTTTYQKIVIGTGK